MYRVLLVTLFVALTTAQQPTKLNKSQGAVLAQALASLESSVRSDPAWSSIYSIMTTATGLEGAAATFVRNKGDHLPITASADLAAALASGQSKYSSIVTELPSQAYAAYASVASIESKIIASVYSAASAEAGLTASGSTSTATSTPTPSTVQTTSTLVAATTTSVPTGGAERMKQLGCVAAMGVIGAGAILL